MLLPLPRLSRSLAVSLGLLFAADATADTGKVSGGTFGLVIVSMRTAAVETPYMDECPEGVAIGNDEIWWKALNPRERDKMTGGGDKEAAERRTLATMRGPKGEDVCWNPSVVQDPPQRIIKGRQSYGLNLDGTTDGRATPASCKHTKFVGLDGRTAVDNQMYRVVGCIHGWRSKGYIEPVSDQERRDSSQGVTLIQVSGVDTLQESEHVTVRFYRSADVLPKDSQGAILPYASYRIDGNPRYGGSVSGRIHNGVLTTDPRDIHLPFYGNRVETEFFIRGLQLQINLADDHASGIIAGYHDLENWWDYVRKMGYLIETAQFSCPALYQAARQLADGYPDSKTGECSALSVAYHIEAQRAFVVETPKPIADLRVPRAPAAIPKKLPADLQYQDTAIGTVVTNSEGKTLYLSEQSGCARDCAARFAPAEAPWVGVQDENWSIVKSPDGLRQWAFAGKPLYTCKGEERAGALNCLDQTWHPVVTKSHAALPGWLNVQQSEVGNVLTDPRGHTLYKFLGDMGKFTTQICDAQCLKTNWQPVPADAAAVAVGAWAPLQLGDQRVWGFRGAPVYTYAGDDAPGVIAGHRFGGASVSVRNWFSALTVTDALQATTVAANPANNER